MTVGSHWHWDWGSGCGGDGGVYGLRLGGSGGRDGRRIQCRGLSVVGSGCGCCRGGCCRCGCVRCRLLGRSGGLPLRIVYGRDGCID
jgi:hypothetical protein